MMRYSGEIMLKKKGINFEGFIKIQYVVSLERRGDAASDLESSRITDIWAPMWSSKQVYLLFLFIIFIIHRKKINA